MPETSRLNDNEIVSSSRITLGATANHKEDATALKAPHHFEGPLMLHAIGGEASCWPAATRDSSWTV